MIPTPTTPQQAQQQQIQTVISEFESYSFSDDAEFKAGLPTVVAAIRGRQQTPGQIDEMIGRAQWFYFMRLKGLNIPWETYIANCNSPAPSASASAPNLIESFNMMHSPEKQGMNFDMLCTLISEGRANELPVQQIPQGLNENPASQSSLSARPKPWESFQPQQPYQYYPQGPPS
ncbi:hypothetical protein P7C73_g1512, partial [Tremellales sp. Uapishka_1]